MIEYYRYKQKQVPDNKYLLMNKENILYQIKVSRQYHITI